MVVVKYKKLNEGKFFSHLNMIRIFNRLLSIGSVDVKYSEGFNKTRRIYFSSPTRVGVESECEYLIIDTDEKAKDVKYKIENILPQWMELVSVYAVDGKLNVAALNKFAQYQVQFDDYKSTRAKVKQYFEREKIEIKTIQHGEEKVVDVKDRIKNYSTKEDYLIMTCGVGDKSVKPDELIKDMLAFIGKKDACFDIKKMELYCQNDQEELVCIDEKAKDVIVSE